MKILILSEMVQGVTKNSFYDVTGVNYTTEEGETCEKDDATYETFYYINKRGEETYDYRDIKTKERGDCCNDFEVFERDIEIAKWLINRYNLNVVVEEVKDENLKNSSKTITYEILVHDTQNDVIDTTTYGYESIEECKKDFGLYTSDIEKVIGIKKIERIETEIKIEDL